MERTGEKQGCALKTAALMLPDVEERERFVLLVLSFRQLRVERESGMTFVEASCAGR